MMLMYRLFLATFIPLTTDCVMYIRTCTPALGIHVLLHKWCSVTEPAYVHVYIYMQPAQCVYCVECGIRLYACRKGKGVSSDL